MRQVRVCGVAQKKSWFGVAILPSVCNTLSMSETTTTKTDFEAQRENFLRAIQTLSAAGFHDAVVDLAKRWQEIQAEHKTATEGGA